MNIAYRRKMGRSFFYHHEACLEEVIHANTTSEQADSVTEVPLDAIVPGTVCCGCWKSLHDANACLTPPLE